MYAIRKLRADEVEEVCRVDREGFFESPVGDFLGLKDVPEEERKTWQSVPNFRAYCSEHPDWVLVAVADERIAGFATLEYWPEKEIGKVVNTTVLSAYRGQGIGLALIQRLIEELAGLGARSIEVSTAYVPAACRMYERAGFKLLKWERKKTKDGREYDDSDYEWRAEGVEIL